jgi:hypothetical protein
MRSRERASMMLAGLRSRWATPSSCATASASKTGRSSARASAGDAGAVAAGVEDGVEGVAVDPFEDDPGGGAAGGEEAAAEVEDADDAGVFEAGDGARLEDELVDELLAVALGRDGGVLSTLMATGFWRVRWVAR